jgi:hypothetical protein
LSYTYFTILADRMGKQKQSSGVTLRAQLSEKGFDDEIKE